MRHSGDFTYGHNQGIPAATPDEKQRAARWAASKALALPESQRHQVLADVLAMLGVEATA